MKSVNAPALDEAGLKKLFAFAKPLRLKRESNLFDVGYEAAKADLMEKLTSLVARPQDQLAQMNPENAAERQARKNLGADVAAATKEAQRYARKARQGVWGWFS